jgi:hypothetical protein
MAIQSCILYMYVAYDAPAGFGKIPYKNADQSEEPLIQLAGQHIQHWIQLLFPSCCLLPRQLQLLPANLQGAASAPTRTAAVLHLWHAFTADSSCCHRQCAGQVLL